MAAYATTYFNTNEGSYATVGAEMVVKLDTLDSTNNPIILAQIVPVRPSSSLWVGIIIYD